MTVRKNYIKCDILIVFFGGFGLREPKIFRRKSLKNVIKYIILSHFFEPNVLGQKYLIINPIP